jgi:hypothetical protein
MRMVVPPGGTENSTRTAAQPIKSGS